MQKALLKTFKAFSEYCKENGLTYYAAYGTLIGAVRHHGFIPWDDDVDVFMKREDYDRFVALRGSLDGTEFGICDVLDGESPYPFAKFYSKQGSIMEYKHFPFVIGPWVDVFPLDEGTIGDRESEEAFKKLHYTMWKYRKSLSYMPVGEMLHIDVVNLMIEFVKRICYTPFKKRYQREMEICIERVRRVKGEMYRSYYEGCSNLYIEKSWIHEVEKFPFEDMEIIVPKGWHQILSSYYGNYMKLPPLESRKPGHVGFYTNLIEKKNAREILKENREGGRMSFKVIWDEFKHRKGF